MIRNRLVLTLLLDNGILVNSREFNLNNICEIDTVLTYLNFDMIDELIILDISREKKDINKFKKNIEKLTKKSFLPVSAGGGISSIEDCKLLLASGVDKVVLNTIATTNIKFINELSNKFGKQFIVISIDVKKVDNRYEVYSDNGTKKTTMNLVTYIKELENNGAGELYIRSITHDGCLKGYDLELLKLVRKHTNLPIIIAGGVGDFIHLKEGIEHGANAVNIGNLFHYIGESLIKAKDYMRSNGIDTPNSYWNFSLKGQLI